VRSVVLPATIIDGVRVADTILADTREQAAEFEKKARRKACLATVLVGDEPASHT
jgi:methylenetetrahydrofolate dehydrogenase (NADP+) / methenyltetrahydrofolate cyclohydrolase